MTSFQSRRGLVVAIVVVLVSLVRGSAQTPAPNPFVGRWEITLRAPGNLSPVSGDLAHFIVDVTLSDKRLDAKFVDVAAGLLAPNRIKAISSTDDELTIDLEATIFGSPPMSVVLKGKRVGDRLEGFASEENDDEKLPWAGAATTKTSLVASAPANGKLSEQAAYAAALTKAPAMRATALQKFLEEFPDSALKEQATLQLALSYPAVPDRQAALRRFINEFPDSSLKDQAAYPLAMSETNIDDRIAALRRFVVEYSSSAYREAADYLIVTTLPAGAEREAAQREFVRAYPESANSAAIYRTQWETYLNQTPVDEPKLGAAIDGFINATPNMFQPAGREGTTSLRAQAMNTVADRLMTKGVLLNKALEIIQQAIATAGPTEVKRSRAGFTTTLGEVLFKLKDTDRAEQELKRAVDIGGAEGDGEAWLFLGKIAELRHDDAAALDAYLKATSEGAPLDARVSLESLHVKMFGSLAALDDKLDAVERARPKPFDAGHFTRSGPTAAAPERVVLTELFTGAECAPCIAADMAVDGLSDRYDHDTVAVLVYHLHVPGPDPMTNPDSEARAKYYGVSGTPTLIVDGLAPSSGGGPASLAATIFTGVTKRIETRLERAPAAQLTDFQATLSDSTIRLTGDAELMSAASPTEKKTLHLALVQDAVRYTGTNGIRRHTLVVRELIGSPDGMPMQKPGSKTHVDERIDVAVVAQSLDAYLQGYEPKVKPAGFKFGNRADTLDAKNLSIVAFVQNEKTKEVLQALLISPPR